MRYLKVLKCEFETCPYYETSWNPDTKSWCQITGDTIPENLEGDFPVFCELIKNEKIKEEK